MSQTVFNHESDLTAELAPRSSASQDLIEAPLIVIEPARRFSSAWIREVWTYRELLFFLAWRDVKVRYKQTALGMIWVVMQPLLMTLIFTVVLGMLARVPTRGQPYALVVYIGLLPWTFFSSAVTQSVASIVGNSNLITKVYFPRVIIPAASVLARLVDLGVALVVLVGLLLYYRVVPTWQILLLPPLVVLIAVLALGFGMLGAAVNVRYRDLGVVLPVIIQLWMFLSPVLYPASLVRDTWPRAYTAYALNPIAGIVNGFRAAILGQPVEWFSLVWSIVFTPLIVGASLYIFRRVERSFADVI